MLDFNQKELITQAHGHVTPNPDGSKARCGGPGMCFECSKEALAIGQKINSELAQEKTQEERDRETAENFAVDKCTGGTRKDMDITCRPCTEAVSAFLAGVEYSRKASSPLVEALELFEEIHRKVNGQFPGVKVPSLKDTWILLEICAVTARKALASYRGQTPERQGESL